jgi:hypothetical protein
MSDSLTLNDATANLVDEEVPQILDDFNEELKGGGAWPVGWYGAEVLEGYQTQKGKQFVTEDAISSKGDSRNARLCFKMSHPDASKGERTTFDNVNYRESDFGKDRQEYVAQARKDHKGVQGRWNDDPDAQRSSLALAKVVHLEKALGFVLRTKDGLMVPARAVGQKVDVHLTVNKDGFNEINDYAPSGSKTKGKK